MSNKINKEKSGITKRFSVRLPKEQHQWLKDKSLETLKTDKFLSMNDIIQIALEELKKQM